MPLKQYFVQEGLEPGEKPRATKAAFVLQTCALNARKEFEAKTGRKPGMCVQAAESPFSKEDLSARDFWEEGRNRVLDMGVPVPSEAAKRYEETKVRAEKVLAAKKEAGVRAWEDATDEQLAKVREALARK